MFVSGSDATFTIVAFIISILVIFGGWVVSKISKPGDKIKRNISIGMYIWGGITTILNASQIWRIINGTFVEPERSALDEMGDVLSGIFGDGQDALPEYPVNDVFASVVEIFGTSISVGTLVNMISVGIGFLIVVLGLVIYKKKSWAKVMILGGIITIIAGLSQLLF